MELEWDRAVELHQFKAMSFYDKLIDDGQRAHSRKIIQGNKTRPTAVQCLWLACHGKMATKARLKKFGMIDDSTCSLCKFYDEIMNHLFFCCEKTLPIWRDMLNWIEEPHMPTHWDAELLWLIDKIKGKGWHVDLLKMIAAKTIYQIWHFRNSFIFGSIAIDNNVDITRIVTIIIDNILYTCWQSKKLRSHLVPLMI